jgi:hypothetical protein
MDATKLSKEAQEKLPILRAFFNGDESVVWSEAINALFQQLLEGRENERLGRIIRQVDPGYWERD